MKFGRVDFSGGMPDVIRKSTMIRKFRAAGGPDAQRAIDEIEKVHRKFPRCEVHGKLEDPIVAIAGKGDAAQIAICCPHCSDPVIREAWEREAMVA